MRGLQKLRVVAFLQYDLDNWKKTLRMDDVIFNFFSTQRTGDANKFECADAVANI